MSQIFLFQDNVQPDIHEARSFPLSRFYRFLQKDNLEHFCVASVEEAFLTDISDVVI